MSDIALYNALTKLGLEHDAAKEAVADVVNSREVATKSDMKKYGDQDRYSRTERRYMGDTS